MDRSLAAGLALFAILLAAPALLPLAGAGYLTGLLIKGMLLAIAGVSLNLLIGHGGMVSLGHAAFVGVGAYAAAIGLESGIEEILILLAITLAVTGGLAFITGVLALGTTGVYFLMITLAFSQMIYFTLMSLAAYGGPGPPGKRPADRIPWLVAWAAPHAADRARHGRHLPTG